MISRLAWATWYMVRSFFFPFFSFFLVRRGFSMQSWLPGTPSDDLKLTDMSVSAFQVMVLNACATTAQQYLKTRKHSRIRVQTLTATVPDQQTEALPSTPAPKKKKTCLARLSHITTQLPPTPCFFYVCYCIFICPCSHQPILIHFSKLYTSLCSIQC